MKTAISVPDDVFQQVNHTAEKLGISRSELFTRAARAYLEDQAHHDIRQSYDEAFADSATSDGQFRKQVARAVFSQIEW